MENNLESKQPIKLGYIVFAIGAIICLSILFRSCSGIDGTYSALVEYQNSGTGTQERYTLDVVVENETVVEIHFPNGGSLHTGPNNHGYTYQGGKLQFLGSTGGVKTYWAQVIIYPPERMPLYYTIHLQI